MTNPLLDIHTHIDSGLPGTALISAQPDNAVLQPGQWYSIGLHPWNVSGHDEQAFSRMESLLSDPQVLAVGECGLDSVKGPDLEIQQKAFIRHIELSESMCLPLIIHDVHCTHTVLKLHKELKPAQKWLIHGYRGGPQLLRQIMDHGILVSFGSRFNPQSIGMVPLHRLFLETDGKTSIGTVIGLVSAQLGIPANQITGHITRNNKEFLDNACMVQLSGLNL